MNVGSWLLWGLLSTVVMTGLMSVSQGLGLTRMSLPYMLGTFFTPNRDAAKVIGFGAHLVNGLLFSLVYIAVFASLGRTGVGLGALLGAMHGLVVLTLGMQLMPGLHPRMASETHGPTVTRQLEPPGFFAVHYGRQTALWTLAAHIVYGALLGGCYRLPG